MNSYQRGSQMTLLGVLVAGLLLALFPGRVGAHSDCPEEVCPPEGDCACVGHHTHCGSLPANWDFIQYGGSLPTTTCCDARTTQCEVWWNPWGNNTNSIFNGYYVQLGLFAAGYPNPCDVCWVNHWNSDQMGSCCN